MKLYPEIVEAFRGMRVRIDPDVALVARNHQTGDDEDVVCYRLGDLLIFHPDRYEQVRVAFPQLFPDDPPDSGKAPGV